MHQIGLFDLFACKLIDQRSSQTLCEIRYCREDQTCIPNPSAVVSEVKVFENINACSCASSNRPRGPVELLIQRLKAYGDCFPALVLCHSDMKLCLCSASSPVPGHSLISQLDALLADSRSKPASSPPRIQTAAARSSSSVD